MPEEDDVVADSRAGTRPTIFLIEEDEQAHRPLKRNLREMGYRVLAVLDLEDAVELLSVTRLRADLVLIDLVGQSVEKTLDTGRSIRRLAEADGDIPLVVLPDKFRPELEGEDVNVADNDWIIYYENGEQLHRLLNRLLPAKI